MIKAALFIDMLRRKEELNRICFGRQWNHAFFGANTTNKISYRVFKKINRICFLLLIQLRLISAITQFKNRNKKKKILVFIRKPTKPIF